MTVDSLKKAEPSVESWVAGRTVPGFGLDNLPYGVIKPPGGEPRVVVRIGEYALDLAALAEFGLLDQIDAGTSVFAQSTLNPLLELGQPKWRQIRARVKDLLRHDVSELKDHPKAAQTLIAISDVELLAPVAVGDFVDFYSSLEHATNLGKIFRPDSNPLLPNWRHLPVAYHGRSSSIIVSDTPVRRPCGQLPPQQSGGSPSYGPTRALDFELELGFITGPSSSLGSPISTTQANEHIFGFVLVNDWSARDIQRWEYQPLGPFLGKSFATSISPWVVPLEALSSFRRNGPAQNPEPLDYLKCSDPWAFDINLEVDIKPSGSSLPTTISTTNAQYLYWNCVQQLAHVTVNGASIRAGDLYASGTISGPEPGSFGSLIELTWGGRDPLKLNAGTERTYLEDGDTVTLKGECRKEGKTVVSFGEVSGTVLPAIEAP